MAEPKAETDGIIDFSGGMDSYTSPSLLGQNQYVYSVNLSLKTGKKGISTRPGYREILLRFANRVDRETFKKGGISGAGSYVYEGLIRICVCVDGKIFELKEINKTEYAVRFIGLQNNPNIIRAYFSNIPNGLVINDGQSKPIIAEGNGFYRVPNGTDYIKAGLYGAYIQNRFFYALPDGSGIEFSSLNKPTSTEESRLNGKFKFDCPDSSKITALGEKKSIRADTNGGSLLFSSIYNIYSVDVRGPMSNWGESSQGPGVVSGAVFDISATSGYSFLSMNGNTFFRSRSMGIVSLQYLEYIFDNSDITEAQSLGGHAFFELEQNEFLRNVYSVRYKNKIYTTIGPQIIDGKIVWNGIITCKPSLKGVLNYESIFTGIRPWCLVQADDQYGKEYLYAFSRDYDGENRLWMLDESLDYDRKISGERSEIKSSILTRFYSFGSTLSPKKAIRQSYGLSDMSRNVGINICSRTKDSGPFKHIFAKQHNNVECTISKDGTFIPDLYDKGNVDNIIFPDNSASQFYGKQDLVNILGSATLTHLVRTAIPLPNESQVADSKPTPAVNAIYQPQKIYDYKIYG